VLSGTTVIVLYCIHHGGLRKQNACLGEVMGGPRVMKVYVCLQGACSVVLAKPIHRCVRDVDEMVSYDPSCNTDQGV